MSSGEQGEVVTVQDWPSGEAGESAPESLVSPEADVSSVSVLGDEAEAVGDAEAGVGLPSADASGTREVSDKPDASDVVDANDAAVVADEAADTEASTERSEDSPSTPPTRSSRGSVRDLEEEGEVAADYLEELLDIVDVDGDIDIDVENGRASLAIVAESGSDRSLRRLVGAHGEVLEALQELTRLAVQASTGERSRLMLDVAGHRAQRRKVLTDRAAGACEEVKSSGKPLSLEPMSAFERKIVHDVVASAGLESESEGVDPHRHVVITPAAS